MPLPIGTRIGPYEITGVLGAGGMGEVYRARDARLGRDVALKVLPEHFATDSERLARFQREAQVLAALKHPNIGAIYGLEDGPAEAGPHQPSVGAGFSRPIRALVLELVEGETLADRIARGPIPLDEALPIAKQIAEALEAAHEQGVIHRDLKPANIKISPDGVVKVLDFGLAKLTEAGEAGKAGGAGEGPLAHLSMSPTLVSPAATGLGFILGTAAYMAPEQAKGRPADKRSDMWAFGCVLYEMLTAKRAFEGDDVSETLASVLKSEPDWKALPADTPSSIRALLAGCLAKDRRRRVGDAAAALFAFDHLGAPVSDLSPAQPASAPRGPLWRRAVPAIAAAIVVGLAAGYGVWTLKPSPPRPIARFNLALGEGEQFSNTGRNAVAISPDGTHIAYSANLRLYLRAFDQLEPTAIRGTEGGPGAVTSGNVSARSPFFSPDGQWLGFWKDNQIKKVAITGGAPVTLCEADVIYGASWSSDDTILYGEGPAGIWRVPAAGGQPENVIKLEKGRSAHGPQLLPGGRAILFTLADRADWDDAQIVAQSLDTGMRHVLVKGGTEGRYIPTGHLVYVQRGALLAVRFDPASLTVTGGPVPLAEDVGQSVNPRATGAGQFSISDTGTLIYVPTSALVAAASTRTLTWVGRDGREESINAPARAYTYPRLSPDGTRVALDIRDEQNDIWIWDFTRGTLTRSTFGAGLDRVPVWMPDGRRLVFTSNTGSGPADARLYWQAADGTGTAERLMDASSATPFATSISPDGARLVFDETTVGTPNSNMFVLSLEGERRRQPLIQTDFVERNGIVSPDGRWIAYESDASGHFEVYVRPFPDAGGGQWQISTTGGTRPLWARNGRELFYVAPNGALMSVPVEQGTAWKAGIPAQVVAASYYTMSVGNTYRTYDVSPDGKRFLVIKNADAANQATVAPRMIVVQNWFEELKRRVPVN